MKGYYKDPRATRKAIDEEGWFRTGDLGSLDEDDFLKVSGRIKDMILRGGENIYPTEIEMILRKHPKVEHACVVGVPDSYYGEDIFAFVVPCVDEDISQEVKCFAEANLSPYKVPKYIARVHDFPKNPSGKILKNEVKERAKEYIANLK